MIIVPEGNAIRSKKAADLYFKNYSASNKIIVSPLTEENSENYKNQGIPEESLIPEIEATSTYTNATNTLALMKEHGATIVTTDYHTLRTKLTYDRVNENYGYDLTVVTAYPENEGGRNALGTKPARASFFKSGATGWDFIRLLIFNNSQYRMFTLCVTILTV